MKIKKIIVYLILVLGFLICAGFYNRVPKLIPLDIEVDNAAKDFVHKSTIFILPILNVIIYLIINYAGKYETDKKSNNSEIYMEKYLNITIITSFTFLYLILILMYVYTGNTLNIAKFSFTGIGILYIVIGARMDSKRQGYFTDIRTPWTIESDYIFEKTTKFAKVDFIILGIINMLLLFFRVNNFIIYNIITIFAVLLIYFYSYCLYKIISLDN